MVGRIDGWPRTDNPSLTCARTTGGSMSPRRGLGFDALSSRALRPWLHDAAPSGLKRRDRFWLRLDSVRRAWQNPPSPTLPAEGREPEVVEVDVRISRGKSRRWLSSSDQFGAGWESIALLPYGRADDGLSRLNIQFFIAERARARCRYG